MKEAELVWTLVLLVACCRAMRSCCCRRVCGCLLAIASSDLLHEHQDLVDPRNVLLDFSNVMLEHSSFDTLCTPKSLHDAGVLISNIPLNYALDSFNFVQAVVKSNYLTDQLGSLGHEVLVD